MKDGFIKVCASNPCIKLLCPKCSAEAILDSVKSAYSDGVRVIVFPELSLVGVTAGDLAFSKVCEDSYLSALAKIADETKDMNIFIAIGVPFATKFGTFDTAVAICKGEILGIVPAERPIKGYKPYTGELCSIDIDGKSVPFESGLVFATAIPGLTVSIAVGKDIESYKSSANIILNPNSAPESYGMSDENRLVLAAVSKINCATVVSAFAGMGESTTDGVYSGMRYIFQNGKEAMVSKAYTFGETSAVVDFLTSDFLKKKNGIPSDSMENIVDFTFGMESTKLENTFARLPFNPTNDESGSKTEEILSIQAHGLAKRMAICHSDYAVLGISGGIDSTLALLVATRAVKLLGKDSKAVIGITLPCFGTTSKTKNNALALMEALGVTSKTISIKESVAKHLEDIGHAKDNFDVAFENAQARERTQVLMDYANGINGIVVGTGDLSELCLGWATYNGDHMSMYGVNGGVTKTLASYIIKKVADMSTNNLLKTTLYDILSTDISPELLPPDLQGNIAQKTEDKVGPYMLHDFFIYHMLGEGYTPSKVLRVAAVAFEGLYDVEIIKKWLKVFIKRFFTQQFKRSCLPDGPSVCGISLSPRCGFHMPSDGCCDLFLAELENYSENN